MNYIKCPYCGSDTPAVLSRCKNCQKKISDYNTDAQTETSDASADDDDDVVVTPKKKKSGFTKHIILGVIALIVVIAAIKNPSVSESKDLVMEAIITRKINEEFRKGVDNEKNSRLEKSLIALASLIAPAILDKYISIDVTDYVLFSSFKVNLNEDEEIKEAASGIILFGNVIPLSSNQDNNTPESESNDDDDSDYDYDYHPYPES
jgi:hypothetical protein